ncbi:TetR/AcrR family transcriptional regulator [Sphingopyxis sp.]|uniref:TetR/AcrR family transcriptional regulator n=1 Tax=Sphingopyxis sp. TaxID=1908224 RepID=UPI003D6D42A8
MTDRSEGPSRHIWVIAALNALSEGGIDAVKIERLATQIGVSKAPFYWRFKDRSDLLSAVLDYWKDDLTNSLIAKVNAIPEPCERLEALMALSLEEHADGLRISGVEGAIRAWAAQDRDVGDFVAGVDTVRVNYVAKELQALGGSKETAETLAKGIYLALIGLYTARRYTPSLASNAAYASIVRAALNSLSSETGQRDL